MKALIKFLVLILSLMIPIFGQVSAASSLDNITKEQIREIKENLTEMGVDEKTQNSLINKLKEGQIWDSMNVKMKDKGITNTILKTDANGTKVQSTKTVYPDGSVNVVNITIPSPELDSEFSVQDVSGGTASCGSGYCNYYGVKVDGGNGIVNASFLADYTFVDGGYDYISKAYQPRVEVYFGSFSDVTGPVILRAKETSYQSARAYLKWTFNNDAGSAVQYLNLDVQQDTASSSFVTN
ncbi:hypothetical protein TEPIDINF_001741 [Tepidibacillus infernus]|uniref:Uncharacterized protein n=1 Tax=Tepidibacillus decaturensis TaxID=1413211 RepID=A0A135L5N5_9BACI|nr:MULTISPECIES: hypothetical protein [Tepidibacillus]KXG44227.1 hypothetical protein U473_09600 [Tepidibacillus decaturensis]GBF10237.1 hypothetical protein HK1_00249 [Tepidibacillus sp. HK-1]